MTAVDEIRKSLKPPVDQIMEHLEITGQVDALGFFRQVRNGLDQVKEEDDLLELFMMLSMMAFQGFQMDPLATMIADRILAYAEQTAHTFSASDENTH